MNLEIVFCFPRLLLYITLGNEKFRKNCGKKSKILDKKIKKCLQNKLKYILYKTLIKKNQNKKNLIVVDKNYYKMERWAKLK